MLQKATYGYFHPCLLLNIVRTAENRNLPQMLLSFLAELENHMRPTYFFGKKYLYLHLTLVIFEHDHARRYSPFAQGKNGKKSQEII